jgi:hypothetical protein
MESNVISYCDTKQQKLKLVQHYIPALSMLYDEGTNRHIPCSFLATKIEMGCEPGYLTIRIPLQFVDIVEVNQREVGE